MNRLSKRSFVQLAGIGVLAAIGALAGCSKEQKTTTTTALGDDGKLMIFGKSKDMEKYIQVEAQAARLTAKRENPNFGESDELPTLVVIRADQDTPFKYLFRAIKTCQDNGFRNFAMKAMNKSKEAAGGKG